MVKIIVPSIYGRRHYYLLVITSFSSVQREVYTLGATYLEHSLLSYNLLNLCMLSALIFFSHCFIHPPLLQQKYFFTSSSISFLLNSYYVLWLPYPTSLEKQVTPVFSLLRWVDIKSPAFLCKSALIIVVPSFCPCLGLLYEFFVLLRCGD